MDKQPTGAVRKQPRPPPGRVYVFLVITLATFILGLSLGPAVGAAMPASAAATEVSAPAAQADGLAKSQWLMRLGVALMFGTVAGWLVGRGTEKKAPEPVSVDPQQVEQVTGLPVVGTLFPKPATPAQRPRKSLQWMIVPAEWLLMLAVLMSFHAAVTQPTFARRFAQDPFSAYSESVHEWRDWIHPTGPR